jgi:hypothetical protein
MPGLGWLASGSACHLAKHLGAGGEEEVASCAVGTAQSQVIHSDDALEVREQHFALLSLPARDEMGVGGGDIAGQITGALMD